MQQISQVCWSLTLMPAQGADLHSVSSAALRCTCLSTYVCRLKAIESAAARVARVKVGLPLETAASRMLAAGIATVHSSHLQCGRGRHCT